MVNEEPQIWRWCHEIRSPSDIVAILVCVSTFSDVSTSYNFLMINFSEYIPTIKWYMTIIIISYKFIYIYIYMYTNWGAVTSSEIWMHLYKKTNLKSYVFYLSKFHLRTHQLYIWDVTNSILISLVFQQWLRRSRFIHKSQVMPVYKGGALYFLS
jgi:hypothetical protein